MKAIGYVTIWAVLSAITAVQLTLYTQQIVVSATSIILGLASVQALLIVLFYQNVLYEPKSIGGLLVIALLTILTFAIGVLVS